MAMWGKEWSKQITLTDLYNLPSWLVDDLLTISWRNNEIEQQYIPMK